MPTPPVSASRDSEAGFTLIEALVAIVVLVVGLAAIANLFVVASASNAVANQGTAATNLASQYTEQFKAMQFTDIVDGGDVDTDSCTPNCPFVKNDDIPGVGRIHTRIQITPVNGQTKFIRVRSEATGIMSQRTRTELTTFRVCSAQGAPNNCPAP